MAHPEGDSAWAAVARSGTRTRPQLRAALQHLPVLERWIDGPWTYPAWYALNRWRSRAPRTFTDKLRYKLVRDRRDFLYRTADRVQLRDYVERQLGQPATPQLYQVVADPAQLDWNSLPRQYVCKVAHGWRGMIMVSDHADAAARLPPPSSDPGWSRFAVRPDHADPQRMEALLLRWVQRSFGWGRGNYQWGYRMIPRRVVVEELLRTTDRDAPGEWSCFVFNGRCRILRARHLLSSGGVMFSRDGAVATFQYLKDTPLSLDAADGLSRPPLPAEKWVRIIEISERLGQDTDFVRVDLYDLGDRILVGEMTHYPSQGRVIFTPADADAQLGSWWTVPRRYR